MSHIDPLFISTTVGPTRSWSPSIRRPCP